MKRAAGTFSFAPAAAAPMIKSNASSAQGLCKDRTFDATSLASKA
jgi:hypothetical protein